MAQTDDDIVTFLNSAGEEISNDPRWHAKRTLEAAGIQSPAVSSALVAENAALQARIAELEAAAASHGVDEDIDDDDDEDETEDQFRKMSGKELQAFAKENDLDIKGLKTVGDVRSRLRELTAE
jgi:hypothetical protein